MQNLPIIAITMGDPAGIGAEIIVKALARPEVRQGFIPLVVGDIGRLEQVKTLLGSALRLYPVGAAFSRGDLQDGDAVAVFQPGAPLPAIAFGSVSAQSGEAAYTYVKAATELALAGTVDAICTAPLSKDALHAAGHVYPGHTELIAELAGVSEVSMMLATKRLRVVHVTTHIGLIDAIERINPDLVFRTIARGRQAVAAMIGSEPRIGVCGINPHAGENGLFGRGEEAEKIEPAVARARDAGWNVTGPLPAATLFFRAQRGDFALVVALYHDQGHGPIKVMGIEDGVNVTVGLPIIRTSVDHGTAYDIAGQGVADERSLVSALQRAVELAAHPTATT